MPEEPNAPGGERPRPLVVPDVVEMIPARALPEERLAALRGAPSDVVYEIAMGPLVGHELVTNLTTWDVTHRFVALADLSLEERIRYFPAFTDQWRVLARGGTRLDPLARILEKAPLLLATGVDVQGDYRVVQVGFAAESFSFRMRKGGAELVRIEGPISALREAISPPFESDTERLLDRILVAASDGLVSARAITLAFFLAETKGGAHWAASLPVPRADDALRGAAMARTLQKADREDERTAELLGFGVAHRELLPAFVLTMPEHDLDVVVGGRHQLEVPAAPLWVVATPPPPSAISACPSSPPPRANVKGAERRALWTVLGILAVLVVAVLLGQLRGRGVGGECTSQAACRSKVCITPALSDRPGYCSKYCTDATDCPSDYSCVDLGGQKRACVFGK